MFDKALNTPMKKFMNITPVYLLFWKFGIGFDQKFTQLLSPQSNTATLMLWCVPFHRTQAPCLVVRIYQPRFSGTCTVSWRRYSFELPHFPASINIPPGVEVLYNYFFFGKRIHDFSILQYWVDFFQENLVLSYLDSLLNSLFQF